VAEEKNKMKNLKGLLLTFLSLLLFLSLTAFGVLLSLKSTLLNPEFIVTEVSKLEIAPLAGDLVMDQIVPGLPPELRYLEGDIRDAVVNVVAREEPWLKEQAAAVITGGYAYLLGDTVRLNITVPLEHLTEAVLPELRDALTPIVAAALPPQMAAGAPAFIDQYLQQYAWMLPAELVINESSIPPDVMESLRTIRRYLGYFPVIYYSLLGLMVLLVLGIFLVHRQFRGTARDAGITLVVFGGIDLLLLFLLRRYLQLLDPFPATGLPSALVTWMNTVATDVLVPARTYGIVILAAGVVLLAGSFFIPKPEPED